jgi:D-tyrosyl-tRNA(Tyr) deacylase
MKAVLQRVTRAKVTVAGEVVGEIGRGLVVLLGVEQGDTESDAQQLADKTIQLRIFDDAAGKMNLSLLDVRRGSGDLEVRRGSPDAAAGVLVVSQFTLLGDCRKGRRPSFIAAAPPEIAERLYERFVAAIGVQGVPVATGRFRAMMEVELVNDGPVTLILESKNQDSKNQEPSSKSGH